ncbi:response regulator [Leptospira kmetyi]|uniref:Response regulator n=1 Tax=Leptospira kmetyi TaxID=408139 RepID=A0A5F1XW65_9LEPT|nr:response regulator [Leptospira kmetyi]AYV54985.1 response regulator [Leptospira kmetyi]TGK19601.1 response regulator [Leptospira kmetyi]TGK26541.1 response regulator [Leptospira kmetyi]
MKTESAILPKIMILEDDSLLRAHLGRFFRNLGLEYCEVQNGIQALEKKEEFKPDAYFVDLEMPMMGGRQFIETVKQEQPDSIFVVMTANSEPNTIIDTMNLGVFDYILKPIDHAEYKAVVDEIAQELYKRRLARLLEEESDIRLKKQLDWVSYKRSKLTELDSLLELSKITLNNIKYALFSGGGIGALIALVKMIHGSAEKKDSAYEISEDLMTMLAENTEYIEKNVTRLEDTLTLLNRDVAPKLEILSVTELVETLTECFRTFEKDECDSIEERKLRFKIGSKNKISQKQFVKVDLHSFTIVFHELLVNALKYSESGSVVDVYFSCGAGLFNLYVKNKFDPSYLNGISAEQEDLVKQPFYRLAKFIDEKVKTEKVFSGLGLTLADIVIRKHGGTFGIKNLMDHSIGDKPEMVVLAATTISTL